VTAAFDEFSLLADNAAEAGLAWDGPPALRRQRVALPDGRSLSALVWGTGEPEVVLVHGGAQNAHTWDTVALALQRPLVAVDLPGHGFSDWRDDHDYTPMANGADVAVAIDALAPNARLVVGMSLGGLTSIALTPRHPALVRRLMLVDITPGVNAEKSKAIVDFVSGPTRFASFDEILERTVSHNQGRSLASLRRGVLHNAKELPDGAWAWRWDPVRTPGATDDAAARYAALWDDLSAITVPITLVRGSLSPVVDDDDVAELLRRQPKAEVVVVDGAGHSVQGDRPVEAARLIAEHLDRT
jgi:pimeloyl-ACP methyl ester carboxylesterase